VSIDISVSSMWSSQLLRLRSDVVDDVDMGGAVVVVATDDET
jgi:hypothetical protein